MMLNFRDRFMWMYSIHLPLKKQDIDLSNEAKIKKSTKNPNRNSHNHIPQSI
ncbi:hypothetical protein BJX62DRAFT_207033 [Aspergillus germanicus]